MKRVSMAAIALALGLILFLVACSSDNNDPGGTGSQTVQGDTNDPSYQFVRDQVGTGISGDFGVETDLIFQMLAESGYDLGVSKASGITHALSAGADDSVRSLAVSSWQFTGTHWFIFQFEALVQEIEFNDGAYDTTLIHVYGGTDSLQLLLDGTSVDSADIDQGINGFDNRSHASIDATGPNLLISSSINHRIQFTEGYQQNYSLGVVNAQLDDTLTMSITGDTNFCEIGINQNTTITDLVIYLDGGDCPLSGSAASTAGFNAFCTGVGGVSGLNLNGGWTISAEVDGSMRHIVVVRGNTRWDVTEPNINCD